MHRRKLTAAMVGALAASSVLFIASSASATPAPTPAPINAPPYILEKGSGYVVANPAAAVQISADKVFYPTGPVSAGTLVVISNSDGSLPGGLTITKLQAMASQRADGAPVAALNLAGGSARAAAGPATTPRPALYGLGYVYYATSSGYGDTSTGRGELAGSTITSLRYSYSPCCDGQYNIHQGMGWYNGYNGSVYGKYGQWYQLSGASGRTLAHHDVPWAANTAASAQLRGQCEFTLVCSGSWDSSF